jgi:hypothetical protein
MMGKQELIGLLQRLPDVMQVEPLEVITSDLAPWGYEPCNLAEYRDGAYASREARLQQTLVFRVVCEIKPPEAIANMEIFKRGDLK